MMIVAFLVGIHIALILIYSFCIDANLSRLKQHFLLIAIFMPFVGELCLLLAEIGAAPGKSIYESRLINMFECNSKSNSDVTYIETDTIDINKLTSSELLSLLRRLTDGQEKLLKQALSSEDSEVVHIAAAALMKIEQEHEKKINVCAEIYAHKPDNMQALKNYILSISEYYNKNILEGESAKLLEEQRNKLIEKYLSVMPGDTGYKLMVGGKDVSPSEFKTT